MSDQRAGADRRNQKSGQRCAHCDPDLDATPPATPYADADGPGQPPEGESGTGPRHEACAGARRKKRTETPLKRRCRESGRVLSIRRRKRAAPLMLGLAGSGSGCGARLRLWASSSREKGPEARLARSVTRCPQVGGCVTTCLSGSKSETTTAADRKWFRLALRGSPASGVRVGGSVWIRAPSFNRTGFWCR
jgi:hypothetical protein